MELGSIMWKGPDAGRGGQPPLCPVFHKKPGSSRAERLCSHFMIRGFACPEPPGKCQRPHLTNMGVLTKAKQKQINEWVVNTPDLSWVQGKAPAGI